MLCFLFLLPLTVFGEGIVNNNIEPIRQLYQYPEGILLKPLSNVAQDITPQQQHNQAANPLLAALLLSAALGISPINKHQGLNHSSVNPYITLLLSQYGRYLPVNTLGTKGIYYYAASNNYHNNKPFGSYKVYENT